MLLNFRPYSRRCRRLEHLESFLSRFDPALLLAQEFHPRVSTASGSAAFWNAERPGLEKSVQSRQRASERGSLTL